MTTTATRPHTAATDSEPRVLFTPKTDDPPVAARAVRKPLPAKRGWKVAGKYLCLAPLFPMAGYLLMDQTGFSLFLVKSGIIPKAVLGEGFGHVGLCFSFHYVITAVKAILPYNQSKTTPET